MYTGDISFLSKAAGVLQLVMRGQNHEYDFHGLSNICYMLQSL